MSWMGLDDQILNHPKFIRAVKRGGSEVIHMWLGIRAYCAQHLTDGYVPADMLDEVRGPAEPRKRAQAVAVLKEVGLLEEVSDGLQMHDYLDWSKSRESILASRVSARERQAKSRGAPKRDGERESQRESQRDIQRDTERDEHRDCEETSASVTEPYPILSDPDPENPKAGSVVAKDLSGLTPQTERPRPRQDLLSRRILARVYKPDAQHLQYAMGLGLSFDEYQRVFIELRDKHGGKPHDVAWLDDKFSLFLETAANTKKTRRKPSRGASVTAGDMLARQLERVAELEAEEAAGGAP